MQKIPDYGSVMVLLYKVQNETPAYRLMGWWYEDVHSFICEMRQVTTKSYIRLDNTDIVQ